MSHENGELKEQLHEQGGRIDQLYERIAQGAEATQLVVTERKSLRTQNDRMSAELSLLREHTSQLDGQLKVVKAERDHYMRYCTEITTRLNNIQLLITSTVEESKHSAYKPTQILNTRGEVVSTADVAKIENLLNRLPKNNGDPVPNKASKALK